MTICVLLVAHGHVTLCSTLLTLVTDLFHALKNQHRSEIIALFKYDLVHLEVQSCSVLLDYLPLNRTACCLHCFYSWERGSGRDVT